MQKVLVIEDEVELLNNIVEMLELEGFDVLSANNGLMGVDIALNQKPDLIICDITMPGLDGYEVLVRIRNTPATATTPFIFLTARADRPFMRHGMELGADDYLTKPFTLFELRSAIDTRLNRHKTIIESSNKDLNNAKRALIRLVSHELRTPLVSINVVTDVMSRQISQLSGEQLREMLETLERGTQRLNRLVEQIVLIVQIEARMLSQDLIKEHGLPIRLSELLIASIDLARRFTYRQPNVSVQLDEHDQDVMVLGDLRALRHVLAEIISNGLNFSPEFGQVTVSSWQADGTAWVTIVDQGSGIAPERLELILQPFQQIDRETKEQQGIGLGLTLAKQVIELHGGSLEIHSVVDKGTQITIGFPITAEISLD